MRKYSYLVKLLFGLFVPILTGCKSNDTTLIGGQKDKHGCIPSAGYTWSKVRKDCIRVFEDGQRLVSTTDRLSSFAAYVVFSTDYNYAELFLPDSKHKNIVLKQTSKGWANGNWLLIQTGRTLKLYKSQREIYASQD